LEVVDRPRDGLAGTPAAADRHLQLAPADLGRVGIGGLGDLGPVDPGGHLGPLGLQTEDVGLVEALDRRALALGREVAAAARGGADQPELVLDGEHAKLVAGRLARPHRDRDVSLFPKALWRGPQELRLRLEVVVRPVRIALDRRAIAADVGALGDADLEVLRLLAELPLAVLALGVTKLLRVP